MNQEIHEYLSTACIHGRHDYCQSDTGSNERQEVWFKRPAQCKFCASTCECACHEEGDR